MISKKLRTMFYKLDIYIKKIRQNKIVWYRQCVIKRVRPH